MSEGFMQMLEKLPDQQNILSDGKAGIDRVELIKAVDHCSHLLDRQKISRLAIYADNSLNWIITDLACQKLGICLLPLPLYFTSQQLQHSLKTAGTWHILTDSPETLIKKLPGLKLKKQYEYCPDLCLLKSDKIHSQPALPEGTRKITFTSGSTGNPRGVCLSQAQQFSKAVQLAELLRIEKPRHLCALPLSTLLENIAGVYGPMLAGGTVVLPSLNALGYQGSQLRTPQLFLGCLQMHRPDTLILIPQLLKLLVNAVSQGWEAPPFKFVAVGGSKVSPELLQEARKLGIPAYEGYGLSECASVLSLNVPDHDRPGSCGIPLAAEQLDFKNGEILVKGSTMLGYVDDPHSWYPQEIRTGDLGRIDEQGFLHINGREKNLIISSYARNISPEWIESELTASPLISEAVVYGDARPHCIALVYPQNPAISMSKLMQAIGQVNSRLPDYAQIRSFLRLDAPLAANSDFITSNGRPRRAQIENYYSNKIQQLYQRGTTQTTTPDTNRENAA
ncbi:MAG: long-chain fatty acid--CoA ligase [Gammaproteobacteria bacterium]|nr:long-chain fatty acid--CoA ligase [Gammaproteobacteria bacterium]|tara:strand:+ start:25467 stop:26987 length:1521 start_codon:yes stop_codon:yes gene_type:complete